MGRYFQQLKTNLVFGNELKSPFEGDLEGRFGNFC